MVPAAALVLLLVAVGGYGGYTYSLVDGIRTSDALGRVNDSGGINLLVMGLDSRLDEQGHPLPAGIYRALHTGVSSRGGLNSNVLMSIHIPSGGGPAAVSGSLATAAGAAPAVNGSGEGGSRPLVELNSGGIPCVK